jgi:hypothetical protein
MKRFILSLFLISALAAVSFAARQFIEGTDYFTDFQSNEDNDKAAVLHINFIAVMPAPHEAEAILKDQLKVYGKIIEAEKESLKKEKEELEKLDAKNEKGKKKDKPKDKPKSAQDIKNPDELKAFFEAEDAAEEKYKNIIGSVRFSRDGTPENAEKIKYSDDSSAFVWIEKTKRIVPFPDYIKFLKKEREDRKQKENERALMLRQLAKNPQDTSDEEDEPLP